MALVFGSFLLKRNAVQYTLLNQADMLAYLQSIYGVSAYLNGNIIINPKSAMFLGDWLVVTDSSNFERQTDAEFQLWNVQL